MIPKEKAQDLYQMYYECLWHQDEQSRIQNEKQGALIAVDEILNDDWYITTLEDLAERRKYWRQVKQEIKKL